MENILKNVFPLFVGHEKRIRQIFRHENEEEINSAVQDWLKHTRNNLYLLNKLIKDEPTFNLFLDTYKRQEKLETEYYPFESFVSRYTGNKLFDPIGRISSTVPQVRKQEIKKQFRKLQTILTKVIPNQSASQLQYYVIPKHNVPATQQQQRIIIPRTNWNSQMTQEQKEQLYTLLHDI